MGEVLVEIMRPKAGMALCDTARFKGLFPSGAPAIFIDRESANRMVAGGESA